MAEEESSFKFISENEKYERNIIVEQIFYRRILKPPEWLEDLQSLFSWGRGIMCSELVTWNIPGKICDYFNQGAFYGFERLAFLLTMLFMKTLNKEEKKFWKKLPISGEIDGNTSAEDSDPESEDSDDEYEPEKCYAKCVETVDEMATNEGDVMYSRIGPSLRHVLQATRAHMLFFSGNEAESQEIARNIQPLEEMSPECKAGFEGLKAKVVMSMYQNYQIVLPYLHKAMELDPDFGYWPYLVGKVLRRARREFDEGSLEEEFKYFEKAVSLERNPKFLVFLGQAYQERAMSLHHSGGPSASVDQLNKSAVNLYSECWSLKNDSAAIARRVGNGMGKMWSGMIDKTVAKEAMLKAIELSPNECTHLNLGKYYYIHEMNDEKALEHFQQCHPGDFGTSEIIRLNLIKDPDYDPHDILQTWLKLEKSAVKQYRSFCDAAWYYLAFKRDLEEAAKYIWLVIKRDDKSIRAKRALEFKSYGFCVERPLNLIEILVNEILLAKEKNESLPTEERKDLKKLEDLLQKLLGKYPDLHNMDPKPNLIEDLKREVDHSLAVKRRRRYGTGRNRNESGREVEQPLNWRSNRTTVTDSNQESDNHNDQNRQQEGDRNRRFQWQGYTNRSNSRSDARNSFSGGDEERGDRVHRDDHRRNSESQSHWRNVRTTDREGTSGQNQRDNMFAHNKGRSDRQRSSYNNSRYDVTLSDWRSENRRQ